MGGLDVWRVTRLVAVGIMLASSALVLVAPPARADGETVSISDLTLLEGSAGKNVSARFTVTLSAPRTGATKVTYSTADGSAAGGDYLAKSGTVSIGSGKTSATLTIVVTGDDEPEPTEEFTVNLVAALTPTVSILDGIATGTIVDDDPTNPPMVSIGDTLLYEGNSGTQSAVFVVSLSAPKETDTLIPYSTQDGSATAPADYKAKTGTVRIAAGRTAAKVSITTYGNIVADGSRFFSVNLGASSVPILDGTGDAVIMNDEGLDPGVSIGNAVVMEGDTGTVAATIIVTLSAPALADTSISYSLFGLTATPGLDFKAKSGALKIRAGKATGKISVTLNGDTLAEGPEQIDVSLTGTGSSGIAIIDGVGSVTIDDDDVPAV